MMLTLDTKQTLRALIIGLLSEQFPLQVADIRAHFHKKKHHRFSAQAIHKALNELMKDDVVVKKDRAYQLRHEYILQLDTWVKEVKYRYFARNDENFFTVSPGTKKAFEAETLTDVGILWDRILEEKLFELEDDRPIYTQHVQHPWFYLAHMGQETRIVNLIMEKCEAFYTLVNGNTTLDQWLGKLYTDKQMFYQTKSKPETGHQYPQAVLGPYIIEVHYPKKIAHRLDRLFSASDTLSNMPVLELYSLVNTPITATIILHHDTKCARTFQKKMVTAFKI